MYLFNVHLTIKSIFTSFLNLFTIRKTLEMGTSLKEKGRKVLGKQSFLLSYALSLKVNRFFNQKFSLFSSSSSRNIFFDRSFDQRQKTSQSVMPFSFFQMPLHQVLNSSLSLKNLLSFEITLWLNHFYYHAVQLTSICIKIINKAEIISIPCSVHKRNAIKIQSFFAFQFLSCKLY